MNDLYGQIGLTVDSGRKPCGLDSAAEGADGGKYPSLTGPFVARSESVVVAISGRPAFRGYHLPSSDLAEAIAGEVAKHGTRILTDLRGPFALVVFLPLAGRAIIAVDRMGIEKLAWSFSNGQLIVGNSAEWVASMQPSGAELDLQALFGFMLTHMVPAPHSVFRGVNKLLPGSVIEFTPDSFEEHRYWLPSFDRSSAPPPGTLSKATLPTLGAAVKRSVEHGTAGAFLSGGLDSSCVSGLLSGIAEHTAPVFSVGFGVEDFDELSYARIAAEHFGCRHFQYEVTPKDIVDSIPEIASTFDEPFGNSSAVPTLACARLAARHDIRHLLAGDGGDELFAGNERYVRQSVFEHYNRVPSLLRHWILEPAANRLDPEDGPYLLRKFASYVRQARIPLPERFESWNLIYREGPAAVFSETFLSQVDVAQPLRTMAEIWNSCPSSDLLDRMLWYDWKYTLADNDLRKVSQMCALAGVEVSYPMLDESVVNLSIQVPSTAKINRSELRAFFKGAVRGFLPEEIIRKKKHGFGLPFGQWLKEDVDLQGLVYGNLKSLGSRQIFNPAFLDRVAEEHRSGHASYYGYAIWDLVMLEQWLLSHKFSDFSL